MKACYYYDNLERRLQQVYFAIYEGLRTLQPSFPVPMVEPQELTDVYFQVRLDHPEIFYSVTFKYRFYNGADHFELVPEYLFPKKKLQEQIAALEARVTKLARPAMNLDERGKELYVHDFIVKNVHYDKLKKPYSHEIIGALGQGVAVCEGIAKAVKILCDRLGLWCIVAMAHNNPEKGIKYRHAWNIVKLGKSFYHLDATFDNTISGELIRYDYVNLSDAQIFRDHEQPVWPLPACTDGDHFYYKEKKISFTKLEEVRSRALQAAKKKKPLLFHWRGGYLTREVLKSLMDVLAEEAAKRELIPALSLNWPQAVLMVTFGSEQKAMEIEQTNEGELYEDGGYHEV